jgi:hypothetical protein
MGRFWRVIRSSCGCMNTIAAIQVTIIHTATNMRAMLWSLKVQKGEITHSRATKTKYLSDMDLILNCKAGEVYDQSLT